MMLKRAYLVDFKSDNGVVCFSQSAPMKWALRGSLHVIEDIRIMNEVKKTGTIDMKSAALLTMTLRKQALHDQQHKSHFIIQVI